ncbi:hypothetical protein CANCADRAFT_107197 [Tortispora caseinolytica NRRL Y-17796]|uniref:Uncharacterized protein n=1 Tax=Tortispora caseinolytica NRRL Y-17796 TaxID=767744 RepID=A0A1E4TFG8_9ASCO|nr:hypothetical protein CANCADRAFT_107197 [Tortispora caseinolytica NRRL Y-17796]
MNFLRREPTVSEDDLANICDLLTYNSELFAVNGGLASREWINNLIANYLDSIDKATPGEIAAALQVPATVVADYIASSGAFTHLGVVYSSVEIDRLAQLLSSDLQKHPVELVRWSADHQLPLELVNYLSNSVASAILDSNILFGKEYLDKRSASLQEELTSATEPLTLSDIDTVIARRNGFKILGNLYKPGASIDDLTNSLVSELKSTGVVPLAKLQTIDPHSFPDSKVLATCIISDTKLAEIANQAHSPLSLESLKVDSSIATYLPDCLVSDGYIMDKTSLDIEIRDLVEATSMTYKLENKRKFNLAFAYEIGERLHKCRWIVKRAYSAMSSTWKACEIEEQKQLARTRASELLISCWAALSLPDSLKDLQENILSGITKDPLVKVAGSDLDTLAVALQKKYKLSVPDLKQFNKEQINGLLAHAETLSNEKRTAEAYLLSTTALWALKMKSSEVDFLPVLTHVSGKHVSEMLKAMWTQLDPDLQRELVEARKGKMEQLLTRLRQLQ